MWHLLTNKQLLIRFQGTFSDSTSEITCTRCADGVTSKPGSENCSLCLGSGRGTDAGYGGYYWNPDEQACLTCPTRASCVADGLTIETIVVREGFWRRSTDSIAFRECPSGNHGCLGGNNTESQCGESYEPGSPLCAVCIAKSTYPTGGRCKRCSSLDTISIKLIVFGTVVLVFFFLIWLLYRTLSRMEEFRDFGSIDWQERQLEHIQKRIMDKKRALENRMSGRSRSFKNLNDVVVTQRADQSGRARRRGAIHGTFWTAMEELEDSAATSLSRVERMEYMGVLVASRFVAVCTQRGKLENKMKILIGTYQLAAASSFNLGIDMPNYVNELFTSFTFLNFNLSDFMNFSCTFGTVNYSRTLYVTTMAPGIFLVLSLCYLQYHRISTKIIEGKAERHKVEALKKEFKEHRMWTKYFILGFVFAVYPSLCTTVTHTFKCDWNFENEDGKRVGYLVADYSIACTDKAYTKGLFVYAICMTLV